MSYVLVCQGLAGSTVLPSPEVPIGAFLQEYDPEAHGGRGLAKWTYDGEHAMKFEDSGAAFVCWRQQSKTLPLRADGHPNRPLTAFTVEVIDLEA